MMRYGILILTLRDPLSLLISRISGLNQAHAVGIITPKTLRIFSTYDCGELSWLHRDNLLTSSYVESIMFYSLDGGPGPILTKDSLKSKTFRLDDLDTIINKVVATLESGTLRESYRLLLLNRERITGYTLINRMMNMYTGARVESYTQLLPQATLQPPVAYQPTSERSSGADSHIKDFTTERINLLLSLFVELTLSGTMSTSHEVTSSSLDITTLGTQLRQISDNLTSPEPLIINWSDLIRGYNVIAHGAQGEIINLSRDHLSREVTLVVDNRGGMERIVDGRGDLLTVPMYGSDLSKLTTTQLYDILIYIDSLEGGYPTLTNRILRELAHRSTQQS